VHQLVEFDLEADAFSKTQEQALALQLSGQMLRPQDDVEKMVDPHCPQRGLAHLEGK
jgi:hypothetical protein